MYKIMILGAGGAQLNLIKEAKDLRYYIIVCDMRSDTQAQKLADRYYRINYLEKEKILDIAKEEAIDGIISNSEPAMLTVAYISQQLGLVGNTLESIETLLSKSKFRDLQKRVGIYSPQHYIISSLEELLEKASVMKYPIIVKPTQCSGTRGTTRLDSFNELKLKECFEICKKFSRNDLVTIEEYVEMSCLRVNGADVFVMRDEYIWDGWLWTDRSPDTPMLPMTEIFPMAMPGVVKNEIKTSVEKLLRGAGVTHGEYNVETFYTPKGELFVIEINPRQAGNNIPQLIEEHTGVNLTKLLVSTAVNDMSYYNFLKSYNRENNYITHQVVFSKEDGMFDHLYIDPELEVYVQWRDIVCNEGDWVVKGINAADAVAFVDLKFDTYELQHKYTDKIEKYIYPVLKDNGWRES